MIPDLAAWLHIIVQDTVVDRSLDDAEIAEEDICHAMMSFTARTLVFRGVALVVLVFVLKDTPLELSSFEHSSG